MSLKGMTTAEMLSVSGAWVGKGAIRTLIEGNSMMSGLLPAVEMAHSALRNSQLVVDHGYDAKLALLVEESAERDGRHDTAIRGVYGFLSSLADLVVDDGATLLDLRDFLLPEGLIHARKSFRGQAAEAELLVARLESDPSKVTLLQQIPVGPRTLHTIVLGWIEEARQLVRIENEKRKLSEGGGPTAADVNSLRNAWIRTTHGFRAVADLARLDEELRGHIFGPLDALEKTAERRGKTRTGDLAIRTGPPSSPSL